MPVNVKPIVAIWILGGYKMPGTAIVTIGMVGMGFGSMAKEAFR